MEIRFGETAPKLTIRHQIRNDGNSLLVLAFWTLTMIRLGGTVIQLQLVGNADLHDFLNIRILTLWL